MTTVNDFFKPYGITPLSPLEVSNAVKQGKKFKSPLDDYRKATKELERERDIYNNRLEEFRRIMDAILAYRKNTP